MKSVPTLSRFRRPARGVAVRVSRVALLVGLALVARAGIGAADPTLGFVEEWSDTSLAGWTGGATYSNPGTGGYLGVGDGFLRMATPTPGRLAGFSTASAYQGNWQAAGINTIEVWLNDVDADDPLEMHVMIVSGPDLWNSTQGFQPPEHAWGRFEVDLLSPAGFTHVTGTRTFDQAMQSVDRLQIRHDTPPFLQPADVIQADVGIDHVRLFDRGDPAIPGTWGRIKALYR